MRIYFAGSIRGGRQDAGIYHRMVAYLKRYGEVLTEHVGDLHLKESRDDRRIYAQDMAWLRSSDVLVGECTCPSLGVGYELACAEALGIPCHLFYDRTRTDLSAMLTGNPYFQIHPYETEDEIYPALEATLRQFA